jgi:hypothetical protein
MSVQEPPKRDLFSVTEELAASSTRECRGMSFAPCARAAEEKSTMALMHPAFRTTLWIIE